VNGRWISRAAGVAVCLAVAAPANAAVMEGRFLRSITSSVWPNGGENFEQTDYLVGPTVELHDFSGYLDIDVSDTNILITASKDRPSVPDPQSLLFGDLNRDIPNFVYVTVNPMTTWDGFDQGRVIVRPNEIYVKINSLAAISGQKISLDVYITVPEPGSLTLLGFAAFGAVRMARRDR
jgi:hypothetical protein